MRDQYQKQYHEVCAENAVGVRHVGGPVSGATVNQLQACASAVTHINDLDVLFSRLREVNLRTSRIADALAGPTPQMGEVVGEKARPAEGLFEVLREGTQRAEREFDAIMSSVVRTERALGL